MSFRTAKKPILLSRGRNRKKRPKTFKSLEAANAFAEENKIKKYLLKDLTPYRKDNKKVQLILGQ